MVDGGRRISKATGPLNHKGLLARGGPSVVPKDIAGARFVSQGDARILERVALSECGTPAGSKGSARTGQACPDRPNQPATAGGSHGDDRGYGA